MPLSCPAPFQQGGRFAPKRWPTLLRKAGRFAPKAWLFYSEKRKLCQLVQVIGENSQLLTDITSDSFGVNH